MKKTVGAIIEDNGKILLMKRNHDPFKDHWGLPGGHIDQGETAEQAVIREVKEETNLDFTPKSNFVSEENHPEINWHALVTFFYGDWKGKVKLSNEHTEYGWFTYDETKKMKLAFHHKKILDKYMEEN